MSCLKKVPHLENRRKGIPGERDEHVKGKNVSCVTGVCDSWGRMVGVGSGKWQRAM